MKYIAAILNIPWTVAGLVAGLLAIPKRIQLRREPLAVILHVRSFWWFAWHPRARYARAAAIGNVVLMGPKPFDGDLEHELVHVKQFEREPLIQPFLYAWQTFRYGYRDNKYEREAYDTAGIYISETERDIKNRFEKLKKVAGEKRRTLFIEFCRKMVEYKNEGALSEEEAAYKIAGCIFFDDLSGYPECDAILMLAGDTEIPRTSSHQVGQPWDKKTADANKAREWNELVAAIEYAEREHTSDGVNPFI